MRPDLSQNKYMLRVVKGMAQWEVVVMVVARERDDKKIRPELLCGWELDCSQALEWRKHDDMLPFETGIANSLSLSQMSLEPLRRCTPARTPCKRCTIVWAPNHTGTAGLGCGGRVNHQEPLNLNNKHQRNW